MNLQIAECGNNNITEWQCSYEICSLKRQYKIMLTTNTSSSAIAEMSRNASASTNLPR